VKNSLLALAVAAALAPLAAHATDGYFPHGHGMKAKGMGGAAMAMTGDTMGGADNPATMVFVGNRLDVGIDWFRPDRSAKREGSAGGTGFLDGSADGNERQNFFVPEFGYNKMLSPDLSLGISVVGHGGMNTTYDNNPFGGAFGGGPKGGVDYMQLFIAPTIAYKLNQNHSIGATLNIDVGPQAYYVLLAGSGLALAGLASYLYF